MLAAPSYIPILTSEAGLCLTSENWHATHTSVASYYLDALLIKPGLSVLSTLPNLASYVNCSGTIILNASSLRANKEGIINLISPYDGSKIRLNYSQISALIQHLQPQAVILPPDILTHYPEIWAQWDNRIKPFLSADQLSGTNIPASYGIYFTLENDLLAIKEQLNAYQQLTSYIQGASIVQHLDELKQLGVDYVESNEPAQLGLEGFVCSAEGIIDLKIPYYAYEFTVIDLGCECATCSAQLTKAYLHHLLHHTPLLCQRFLIQHNAHYVQNALRK